MDDYAIASAIATRLGATTPPSGQDTIKLATADFPDALTFWPALIVGLSSMEGLDFASKKRSLQLDYPCTFYLAKSDGTPRRSRALRAWVTVLYPRLSGYMTLGSLAYVAWSEIVAWELGQVSFAGEDWDGGTLTARVLVRESSSAAL